MICWNCQAETTSAALCSACGKLLPPRGATHFELFGLGRDHRLDAPGLDKQFRELSMKLHPDRYARADAKERRFALEHTTALNDAYRTLKDPVRRAFYLLKLSGIDLERDDTGSAKGMPLEFLEEVMELREELDSARRTKDLAKAQQMGAQVANRASESLKSAVGFLETLQQNPEDKEALRKASHELSRVRYFNRFLEEVEAIEEEAL